MSVGVVRDSRTLRAIEGMLAKSDQKRYEFALHSLRIVGATALAAAELLI